MLRLITALVVAMFALGSLASPLYAQAGKEPAKTETKQPATAPKKAPGGRLSLEPPAPFSCRLGHSSREPPRAPHSAVLWSASPWPPCAAASSPLLPPLFCPLVRRMSGGV